MRVDLRRLGGLLAATALAAGGSLVALGGTAGAATFTVDPAIPDPDANSLRHVIEQQATTDGDVVVLAAGATYVLDGACSDLDLQADITVQSSSTTQNATIQQGPSCNAEIFDGDGENSLTLQNLNVTGGRSGDNGGAATGIIDLTVIRSRIFGNAAADDGGAFSVDGDALIIASTLDGNCAEDDGGAITTFGDFTVLINSTVTDNTFDDEGAIDAGNGGLNLVYSDVVANVHDDGAECGVIEEDSLTVPDDLQDAAPQVDPDDTEVEPADTEEAQIFAGVSGLDAFGTVIALPIDLDDPAVPANCEFTDGGTTDSHGFNFSDDDTCGLTNTATGDRENAGDPALGALADNGGPTPTLLPAPTSPLVNFIPIAACGGGNDLAEQAVTDDQRGVARPQDVGCEIGSVELQLVVLFTG